MQEDALKDSLSQLLETAIACHRASMFREAETLYGLVLKVQPANPDANHNMGVLRVQAQRTLEGLDFLLAAVNADPAAPEYWLSYIEALVQLGRKPEAREALALAARHGLEGNAADALKKALSE